MSSTPRSVKISDDERSGWSSDRPRRPGEPERPPRPPDVSVRGRVLAPSERLRYSPGSLLLIVSAEPEAAEALAARTLEDHGALLTLAKVRGLLQGRVPAEQLEEKAQALLDGAAQKRLASGQAVVVALSSLDPAEREHYVRLAAAHRRPRHLLLLEVGKDRTPEEVRPAVDELRAHLDAGELGQEGFATSVRVGGRAVGQLGRIVFAPAEEE